MEPRGAARLLREALEMAEEDPPLPVSMDAFCGRCGDGAGRETQAEHHKHASYLQAPLLDALPSKRAQK